MIPQEKMAAVERGLSEAFGATGYDDLRALTRGRSSALVFRIVVGGTPYLLRIIMRADDPMRHFACMRAATEAGLAPRLRYASVEDRISITDFVEAVPFSRTEALVRMPAVLRTLHALPPFAEAENHLNTTCMFLMNPGPAVDGFIAKFQTANIISTAECEELLARYAQVSGVYPRDAAEMVSSHNDLFKPDNILFDGHRVWLVDWEAAFRNDRYADLAVLANLIVADETEERTYLEAYLGQPADEYQLARFFLMRQITHIFYAMVFLSLGSSGRPLDRSAETPEFADFNRQFWAGEFDLEQSGRKTLYGRVHLERLFHDAQQPRFSEALRIVSTQNARS